MNGGSRSGSIFVSLLDAARDHHALQYWEKSLGHTKAKPATVGQGGGKHSQHPDTLSIPFPVQWWKLVPLFFRNVLTW